MFYDEDDDIEDIDIYEDDEYDGEDEDDDEDEEDDDEETLRELDVDENGHVVEARRKRRRAGGYESFEDTHPEAFGYED